MNKTKISIVVAVDENNGIGKGGKLLFHIPEDVARFKKITTGHPVIMGRKTFEIDIGRCLPNRSNIIVSRNEDFKVEGAVVVNSLLKAIEEAKEMPGSEEIFIIGGGQIFEQAMDVVDKIYLTKVEGKYNCDTFFPDYSIFRKVVREESRSSNGYKYRFIDLEKII